MKMNLLYVPLGFPFMVLLKPGSRGCLVHNPGPIHSRGLQGPAGRPCEHCLDGRVGGVTLSSSSEAGGRLPSVEVGPSQAGSLYSLKAG